MARRALRNPTDPGRCFLDPKYDTRLARVRVRARARVRVGVRLRLGVGFGLGLGLGLGSRRCRLLGARRHLPPRQASTCALGVPSPPRTRSAARSAPIPRTRSSPTHAACRPRTTYDVPRYSVGGRSLESRRSMPRSRRCCRVEGRRMPSAAPASPPFCLSLLYVKLIETVYCAES
jgi:hypothetical protein